MHQEVRMKIGLCLAMILGFFNVAAWAGQEYCGRLDNVTQVAVEYQGYYLTTQTVTARIDPSISATTKQLLDDKMKLQQKEIGTCISGTLSDLPANKVKKDLKQISEITSVRNYNNGYFPDSMSVLKLNIEYKGVWDILPRIGEMSVFTDGPTGKIEDVTIKLWEPVSEKLEDWSVEGITIDELMSGQSVGLPKKPDEPMIEIKAMSNFTAYGGDLKLTFKARTGSESQVLTLKRNADSGKYSLWKNDITIQKISIVTRGLTESSGYVDSYKLN